MGFWSYLFPGDEGALADLFWSNQQTSTGITLRNQIYIGTSGEDTVSFAQLSLSYNPFQSEVYLLEGNDSARTISTSSGTKFYMGDGDDFFTALDGLRYSWVEGGWGDDTIRIKESLWDREGLYHSIITTDEGNDYVLIEKEDRLADSQSGVLGGGIFTGNGDDTLIIKGNGLLAQSSGTSLTYADGSTTRDGIINLGEGNDFFGIYKWNTPPPNGSQSAGNSPYFLNVDIDLGGGDDTVDLRSLDFLSSSGVLVKGGHGYDVAILPLGISSLPAWLQEFESFVYSPNNGNGIAGSITGSGTFQEGVILNAPAVTDDPDGDAANPNYSYQWFKNGSLISNATAPTYEVPVTGTGTYKVAITYTDAQGFRTTVDSPEQVVSVFNNGDGIPGSITGDGAFQEGVTLTAPGVTNDPDGDAANPNYSYQWYKDSNLINDATQSTYQVPINGAGNYKVRIAYTDAQDFRVTAESSSKEINSAKSPLVENLFLPVSQSGSQLSVSSSTPQEVNITSTGSPDLIEIKAHKSVILNAFSTDTWTSQYVAWNVGSTTKAGTGERISLNGLGKYSFVSTAIPEATSNIVLEQDKNTAFFLHDAYSAFYEGLMLTKDSTGRLSTPRVMDVDVIRMGNGGGTSIVDLTSKDYVTGAVTVYGADKGRSIFWGTDANDTFISGGGDSVIYGGAGENQATLGAGKDILQYRSGVGANDVIRGFDPTKDVLQLWRGRTESVETPTFGTQNNSTVMSWAGNTITFEGLANLNAGVVSMVTQFS